VLFIIKKVYLELKFLPTQFFKDLKEPEAEDEKVNEKVLPGRFCSTLL
jgi:hypothetical protein